MTLAIDAALLKYADFAVGVDLTLVREDAIAHLDGKKTLRKISGKRPGKKCGNSYVSADKQCKGHSSKTESGKRKLTAAGKKSAEELAAKVRARKGLKALGKKETPKTEPAAKQKKATKAKASAASYSGAQHPKEWKASSERSSYQPKEWDRGSMKYSISQNGYGQYWPNARFFREGSTNGYPVTIRDRNPFNSFGAAVKFVEKHIERSEAKKSSR